jgi:hypothetical protein
MKLFAVRIENDETILLTAATAEEALERAGLPACLLLQMAPQTAGAVASLDQRYKVIEVDHMYLRFRCTPAGDLNLHDADQGHIRVAIRVASETQAAGNADIGEYRIV